MRPCALVLALALTAALLHTAFADESDHIYSKSEKIPLYSNKVSPLSNPQETYPYSYLPFCQPAEAKEKKPSLGEALQGIRLISTGIDLPFRKDIKDQAICTRLMLVEDIARMARAIEREFWFELFLDDIPIWGLVGNTSSSSYSGAEGTAGDHAGDQFIYTHMRFSVGYNADRVVEVNLTNSDPVPLAALSRSKSPVAFRYSVTWLESDVLFDERMDRLLDRSFFEHRVHWVAIISSLVMAAFLACFVFLLIVRLIRSDYKKLATSEEDILASPSMPGEMLDGVSDSGWKMVSGDVFRPARHLSLFCALIGTGAQMAAIILMTSFTAFLFNLHFSRGAVINWWILFAVVAEVLSGYMSGRYFATHAATGRGWIRNTVVTASLFPSVAGAISLVVDMFAIAKGSSQSIPLSVMFKMIALWLFVALPLVFLGTFIGRVLGRKAGDWDFVHRNTHPIPRRIPEPGGWLGQPVILSIGAGGFAFLMIMIEVYYVFVSFWNYKFYYVYGFLLVACLILMVVCCCGGVVVTYILLSQENYRWQWPAFLAGASVGLFMLVYSFYYYLFRTSMRGVFQTVFFAGYSCLFASILGMGCGFVSYYAAALFVNRIYRNLKKE